MYSLQAYRLEPLLSSMYIQVKPVRMDSAGSGVSQNMVDHASGPKSHDNTTVKKTGFFSTLFGGRSSGLAASEPPPPDKVCTYLQLLCHFIKHFQPLHTCINLYIRTCVYHIFYVSIEYCVLWFHLEKFRGDKM